MGLTGLHHLVLSCIGAKNGLDLRMKSLSCPQVCCHVVHVFVFQVEYAIQAAEKGGLTIGIQTNHGLVLAAQGRRRSPLLKSSSVLKINEIDDCMACAMSGLMSDGRMLVDSARWVC